MLKNLTQEVTDKINKLLSTKMQTSMKVIYIYGGSLMLLILLNVIGWLVNWSVTGAPDIDQLLRITEQLTKPSVVAAVTFVSVFCINKNRDGRPDAAEKLALNGGTNMPINITTRKDTSK